MNILPTNNELVLRCFMLYISRKSKSDNDFNSLVEKAEEGKDREDHGIVVNLAENITMKVSMNTSDTIFVKFRLLNYKNETIDIAEFFYDKDGNFVVKNNSNSKNSGSDVDTLKQLFLYELNK